jgi:hypothetical protein
LKTKTKITKETTTPNSHWTASQKVQLHRTTKATYAQSDAETNYGAVRKKEIFTAVKEDFTKAD